MHKYCMYANVMSILLLLFINTCQRALYIVKLIIIFFLILIVIKICIIYNYVNILIVIYVENFINAVMSCMTVIDTCVRTLPIYYFLFIRCYIVLLVCHINKKRTKIIDLDVLFGTSSLIKKY